MNSYGFSEALLAAVTEYVRTIASQPRSSNDRGGEFPCDYQDTYDLRVANGRIELAQELLEKLPSPSQERITE